MKRSYQTPENGTLTVNGCKMSWTLKRSKSGSAFGIRGSRIFQLELKKDGNVIGLYDYGWSVKIKEEDEEGALCLNYILDRYGKEAPKKKKEMGSRL